VRVEKDASSEPVFEFPIDNRCYFASLVLVALLFIPAESSALCKNPNPNPNPNSQSFANPGDFNGDCKSDIFLQNGINSQLYTWIMNGPRFRARSPAPLVPDGTSWVLAISMGMAKPTFFSKTAAPDRCTSG